MKFKYLLAVALSVFCALSFAQELTILSEEDPPCTLLGSDNKPTGYGVELVTEIQRRLGGKVSPVQIQPWARVYATVQKKPNVVAFTMSRTKEREQMFHWVGPVLEDDWVLVTRKADNIKVSSIEDMRKLRSIGVIHKYAWTSYLTAQKFSNLDIVTDRRQNPKKLHAGHIQAFVGWKYAWKNDTEAAGIDPRDFEANYAFETIQLYIAFSKKTDPAIVDAWQKVLKDMKQDGSFLKIMKKWLPEFKMPGAERPGAI